MLMNFFRPAISEERMNALSSLTSEAREASVQQTCAARHLEEVAEQTIDARNRSTRAASEAAQLVWRSRS